MHRDYYTRRFLITLLAPPLVAVILIKGLFGERTVRVWDFTTLEPAQWDWQFPDQGARKTLEGVEYRPGPAINPDSSVPAGIRLDAINIPAPGLARVKIRARITAEASGQEIPARLALYWARSVDLEGAKQGWPLFNKDRMCVFRNLDPDQPLEFVADPPKSPGTKWNNVIQSLVIVINPSVPAPQGLRVHVTGIRFVK